MNLKHLFAALALMPVLAFANDLPNSKWIAEQDGYKTVDAAATAGVQAIVAIDRTVEYAAVVFEFKGDFYFTQPVTSGDDGSVGGFNIIIPKNAKIVALVHTHPYARFNEFFSNADVKLATELNWTSYVGVMGKETDQAKVIKFEPGKTRTHSLRENQAAGTISDGKFVASL